MPAASSLAELILRPDDSRCIEVVKSSLDLFKLRCPFIEATFVWIYMPIVCIPLWQAIATFRLITVLIG